MPHTKKPVFLNLFKLAPKMSITAKISILHRASGLILFICIPAILWILEQSLINNSFYNNLHDISSCLCLKALYLVLVWAVLHHICAGVRFLFLDIDRGTNKNTAKFTAKIVLFLSLFGTIIFGALIW